MNQSPVPNDDLMDVVELTKKLEVVFDEILEGNQYDLAISALINVFMRCVAGHAENFDEFLSYRLVFTRMFDSFAEAIKTRNDPKLP